ncbi:Hachiman antiphage defense system protein HamA [Yersinia enterocolitica]
MEIKNPYNAVIIQGFSQDGSAVERGTAFFISEKILITAEHLYNEDYSYYFYTSSDNFINDFKYPLNIVIADQNLDIALFSSENMHIDVEPKLSITAIDKNELITAYGFPTEKKNLPANISSNMINDLREINTSPYCYEIKQCLNNTVTDYSGMSGSPVAIDEYIIGLLLFQQKRNTLFLVSFEKINEFIINSGINLPINYSDRDEIYYNSPEHPEYPFIDIYSSKPPKTITKGLGLIFSFSQWHIQELLKASVEWILDYSLTHSQKIIFNQKPTSIYSSALKQFSNGNLNLLLDLFLHMTIRKNNKTIPIINKAIFIDSNEVFSCSHITINRNKIELWLGTSSFHHNASSALFAAFNLMDNLFTLENLNLRFKLITEEIPENWPCNEKLQKLRNNKIPLNKRVDKIIIPLFITYESNSIINYNSSLYEAGIMAEIDALRDEFEDKFSHEFINKVDVRIFIFPAKNINNLFHQFQGILNGM